MFWQDLHPGAVKRIRNVILHLREFHVPLTGLPRSVLFVDCPKRALATSEWSRQPITTLFLDLDSLEAVDDCFGHDVGDRALIAIPCPLVSCLKLENTVARLSRYKFAVLLDGVGDAFRLVKQVTEVLRASIALEDNELLVTASVGVASSRSAQDCPNRLLKEADIVKYHVEKAVAERCQYRRDPQ